MGIEINEKFKLASRIVEQTGSSMFLTGKAGTGKTTFLRELRTRSRKRMIVTAPTGIAAINAGGVTLHSFFQLDFGPFVPGRKIESGKHSMAFSREKIKIIRGLDLLVIDEISMVRSDVLDAVDAVLRRFRDRTLPFGGVQLLLIGDLQQLPPVVVESERALMEANYRSPFFFDSHALQELDYVTLELDKVYRQSSGEFLDILNAVRENRVTSEILSRLNSRCRRGFNPDDSEGYVRITTHNRLADEINTRRMAALPTPQYTFHAHIDGNFPESSFPVEKDLILKEGAQVMFVKNDSGMERRFFNGMLGIVTSLSEETGVVVTPVDGHEEIEVEPMQWENVSFHVNEETKEITEKVDGTFRQYPLKAAWAITIHKSQGLTFDRAIIDAQRSFAHGQAYVALSRCRTLEGLVLENPIPTSAIITDSTVTDFLECHRDKDVNPEGVDRLSHIYQMNLIRGLFNFRPMFNALEGLSRLLHENFMNIYPTQIVAFAKQLEDIRKELVDVGEKFCRQIDAIDAEYAGMDVNPKLQQRIKDACRYFISQLDTLHHSTQNLPTEHDNKKVTKKLAERYEFFETIFQVKRVLLETFLNQDFEVSLYLETKAEGMFKTSAMGSNAQPTGKKRADKRLKHPSEKPPVDKDDIYQEIYDQLNKPGEDTRQNNKSDYSADNINPELFDALSKWRRELSKELGVAAFMIAYTKTLLGISNCLPRDFDSLGRISGVGPAFLKKYGDDVLDLVDEYVLHHEDAPRMPLPELKKGKKQHKK